MIEFNLRECIKNRDIRGVIDNLYGMTLFGIFWVAPLPIIIPKRYISEKIRRRTTTDVDVCERCIKSTIPIAQLRTYVMARCALCNSTPPTWRDAQYGGPDRCQRMTNIEYLNWFNALPPNHFLDVVQERSKYVR